MHSVRETCRVLRKRKCEHKASVEKDGQPTPVSRQFKNNGCNHIHMHLSVLEWCTLKFEASSTARHR